MFHAFNIKRDRHPMARHRSATIDLDANGVVHVLSDDAAWIIETFADVIQIDQHNRLCAQMLSTDKRATPDGCNSIANGQGVRLHSRKADAALTLHSIPRADFGTIVVLYASATCSDPLDPLLTPREREVLALATLGLRRDRMAHRLGISVATIDLHCANLRKKLHAKTTAEAVAKGMARQLA